MKLYADDLIAQGFEPVKQEGFVINGIPLYWVNPLGDIYGVRRTRMLKHCDNGIGYMQVYLTYAHEGGKWFKIHRLVAMQYIPNPDNLSDVNHINGCKEDNRAVNLEWNSHSDNVKHSYDKLGRIATGVHCCKKIMCVTNGKIYLSAKLAAEDTGCKTSNISRVCTGKDRHTKGLVFKHFSTNDTDKSDLLAKILE